jgi:hypothetical protein
MSTADQSRLEFLIVMDGVEGTTDFARRCVSIYRRAALTAKKKRSPYYRMAFLKSYLFHKTWLRDDKLS